MSKHIRFNLRTLLLAVTLIAMGLFWIRWPSMTASSFVADPKVSPTRVIVDFDSLDEQMVRIQRFASDEGISTFELKTTDRKFSDVLVGVQHFDYGPYHITARRGKVAVYGPYYIFGGIEITR